MQIFVIRKKIYLKKWKKILDTATKTGLNALKTVSEKVDHKATEATREFIRIKIADNILKAISYCSNWRDNNRWCWKFRFGHADV